MGRASPVVCALAGAAAICVAFSGCCSGLAPCFKPRCSSAWSCARWDGAAERAVEPGEIAYDASAAGALAEVNLALGGPPSPQYVAMTASSVQCLAAQNASVPNLINYEIRLLEYLAGESKDRKRRVLLIQRDLTQLRSVSRRNEASAAALTVYWQLANLEFQRGILRRTLAEVRRSISDLEELRAREQPVPSDETSIKAQEIELEDQIAGLDKTADQLNGQLRVLFGSAPGEAPYIWPETPLTVVVAPTDADAAVTLGLATRSDLMSLRLVIATLDSDSLPLARAALQQSDGVLGAAQTKLKSIDCDEVRQEVVVRNEQLGVLLADSERGAAEQIRQAAAAVDSALRAVALANQGLTLRRQRQSDVEQLREAGVAGVTSFDLTAARIEVLKAESLLVKQIVAWKTAEVELKKAQGLLASECGYPAVACHFQHCLNGDDCGQCNGDDCTAGGADSAPERTPEAAPSASPDEGETPAPSPDPAVPAPVEARIPLKTVPNSWPTAFAQDDGPSSRRTSEQRVVNHPSSRPMPVPATEASFSPAAVVRLADEPAAAQPAPRTRPISSAPTSAFGADTW